MAELITTPEEDAAASFLDWDDVSLGRAIKMGMFRLQEEATGSNRMIGMAAAMVLISLAHVTNAGDLSITLTGVTHKGVPDGDWKLTLERIRKDDEQL